MNYRVKCPECEAETLMQDGGYFSALDGCVILCPSCDHMFTVRVAPEPAQPFNAWRIE